MLFLWTEYKKTGKKEIREAWVYVKNNTEGVINQALKENIGCYVEGQIAHLKSGTCGKILSRQNYLNNLDHHFITMNRVN